MVRRNIFKLLFSFVLIISMAFTAGFINPIKIEANDITSHGGWAVNCKGEISGSGVYGYTSNYVVNGGAKEIEHAVQNGWHVTAVVGYQSHGVTWYQCWDSDDGDYYGWIDSNYITLYGSGNSGGSSDSGSLAGNAINNRRGEVSGNGVYGYTTNYVVNGGSKATQHAVQDTWHITAKATYYSHGVTWYQCWDTDDGDYYGWIDARYLYFYDSNNNSNAIAGTPISNRKGQVSGNGVYGYTTNYVVNGGSKATQHAVQDTWHITAKATYSSHGVTWYQCWDTDDGDYYGWIDAKYLSFYDAKPASTQSPAPVQTKVVEKTVIVEKTVTVLVTETTVNQETESETTTEIAEILKNNNDNKGNNSYGDRQSDLNNQNNGNLLIILLAVVILLLIIVAVLMIIFITKKTKTPSNQGAGLNSQATNVDFNNYNNSDTYDNNINKNDNNEQHEQDTSSQEDDMYCPVCGSKRNKDDIFCEQCGCDFRQY
ncbi:MAG: zinc ribbon domain-containing protein [Ruminococcus sp.]|nr:zinc ribbon domain-containing protein [Ruminococcus sp.]